jgi:Tfp pilus assembly protein PilN
MIHINLLPGAGKRTSSRRQSVNLGALLSGLSGRLKDKFLIGAVAAVVVSVLAVGALYALQTRQDDQLTAHRDVAVRDSTRYANFLKDRYRSEAVRDTLLRQVNIIRSLDEDRFVWPHIMDEVSRALPQYTWLTMLTYTGTPQGSNDVVVMPAAAKGKGGEKGSHKQPPRLQTDIPQDVISMRLVGRTVDIEALTRFMKDLEASPYLGNVLLDHSELALDQGKEVTQFQLTVSYTRPDTAFVRRVPLSLSVK